MTQAAAGDKLIGTVLSERYRIDALLGEGGMGAVFVGEHLLMYKKVAIKLLHPEAGEQSEAVQRFEREAMAASHINHPNIATATDFGRAPDGSFFLVLEYIEGKNLRKELERGALPPVRAVHITAQIAAALIKAHDKGIVHRDLKPENVMLVDRDGDPDFVKVLDFGVAKVPVDELRGKEVATGQGLTKLGAIYGTPSYMAPEQAMGQEIDRRADLYSIGVMLYEMLCGVRPFDTDNVMELMVMLLADPPPPLSSRLSAGASVPPELEGLVMRLLAKDPEQRVGSARELLDALRPIEASLGGAPPASMVGSLRQPAATPSGAVPSGAVPEPAPATSAAALAVAKTAMGEPAPAPEAPQDKPQKEAPAGGALAEVRRRHAASALAKIPLVVFPAALGFALLVAIGLVVSPGKSPASALFAPSSSAPSAPTEAELAAADVAKLRELLTRYPDDARVWRALVKLHHEEKRPADAVKALGSLVKLKPEVATDDLAIAVIRAALDGPPEAADAAFALLEGGMGEDGVEMLYGLWTAKKDVSSKTQSRAGKSLARPEVKERAPKAVRALIELKNATSCDDKRAAVQLAREAGDARAVPLLQALTAKRGCGLLGMQDCWPCLRGGSLLSDATKAAQERSPR